MNNEPVAWMHHCLKSGIGYLSYTKPPPLDDYKPIPLYTHQHPDNLGLAESIIKQQQLEIEALKKQLEPNMFWNYNDAETGYYEINDVIDEEYHNVWDMEVGHEIEIQQAVRLPNIKVRITKISDDDLEWEVVNESK
jgi:hypothetical protein